MPCYGHCYVSCNSISAILRLDEAIRVLCVFRAPLETPGALRCFAMRRLAASRAFPALPCSMRKTFGRSPRIFNSRQGAGRRKADAFQERQRGRAAEAAGAPRVAPRWFRLCSVTGARRHENRGTPHVLTRLPRISPNLTPPMCVFYRAGKKTESKKGRLQKSRRPCNINYSVGQICISTPAATAEPITPATFGPIACMSRKLPGFSS